METAHPALADEYGDPGEEEPEERTAWYEPGLYRRIGRRRRARTERRERLSVRQRLRARGLHWSSELVVGVFVAVLVTALATIGVVRVGAGQVADFGHASQGSAGGGGGGANGAPGEAAGADGASGLGAGAAGGGVTTPFPEPTSPCIAAPIPGSPLRPCTH